MNMMVEYDHDTMTAVIEFTKRHTAEITTYYAAVITKHITVEITIHMYITAVISEVGQAQDIVK